MANDTIDARYTRRPFALEGVARENLALLWAAIPVARNLSALSDGENAPQNAAQLREALRDVPDCKPILDQMLGNPDVEARFLRIVRALLQLIVPGGTLRPRFPAPRGATLASQYH
ncbi:MAG: hypothetical protein KatS3mg038_1023 [Candidatus Kapaibacterium sp.]|nr:MAG: hypothetical protein KatS3mg038_1023 [Candidatus Kapabacteria bacterium]